MSETARCRELAPLLSERGCCALAPEAEATVAAHLEGCPRCRAEAAGCAEVLALVGSSAGAIEAPELARLAAGALGAFRRSQRRARLVRGWAGGLAAAAAAAALALAPAALRHAPRRPPEAQRWEPPDPDALWRAAAPPLARAGDDAEAEIGLFAPYDGVEGEDPPRRTP